MSLSLKHGHYVAARTLPDSTLKLLGQLTLEWSFLEWRVQQVLWAVFKLTPKAGRIITSQMNNRPRLQIIVMSIELFMFKIDKAPFIAEAKAIQRSIDSDLQPRRNELTHGVWATDPNSPGLFVATTTGSNRSRPQVDPVTDADMSALIADLIAMSERLERFRAKLEASR